MIAFVPVFGTSEALIIAAIAAYARHELSFHNESKNQNHDTI